jgi:hypothetical protein
LDEGLLVTAEAWAAVGLMSLAAGPKLLVRAEVEDAPQPAGAREGG